jgi:hypothetical protein
MKQELINIKYKDYINITVPATFSFKYVLGITHKSEGINFMCETVGDVTAYCILKGIFPEDAKFVISLTPNRRLGIPLEDLECKNLGEIEI